MKSVVVTVSEASGLVCPFTGKPLVVHMNVAPGSITFNAPDAFSAQEPCSGFDALMRRLSMRNGVEGIAKGGDVMRDPYTGKQFQIRDLPDGRVAVAGGFNPRAAKASVEEFAYYASMRGGVTERKPPAPQAPVTGVKERNTSGPAESQTPSDELQQACLDGVLASGMPKPTFVSMSVAKKGGRRR